MPEIAIPRTATATPYIEIDITVLELSETPADALPLRVLMNGQVMAMGDYERSGNRILITGDYTHDHFEVDYYLTQTINLDPDSPASKKPELPELELYSILSSPSVHTDFNQEATDLLLGMVDYSEYDLLLTNDSDLATDAALRSAIILSVYTDAWVDGKNGWWGDTYSGNRPIAACKLWTLMGKPTTPENVQKGIQYVTSAIQWLIDDNHFDRIDVQGEHQRHATDWFAFQLTCHRAGQHPLTLTL
ncbi:phage GP46 family protein [Thiothrix sp.]|jgi:phage gp46-like protein|uniref:phage GP46 family protein n=1 Tax=Thiothrix sp. TaxID=1032 RepID=UPI00257DD285|nr:phage GP46 family protein [Thiothrix sp.]